jgi:hypothetical protein
VPDFLHCLHNVSQLGTRRTHVTSNWKFWKLWKKEEEEEEGLGIASFVLSENEPKNRVGSDGRVPA